MQIENGIVLYHGSYIAVREPNLSQCKPRKDFGRGFYLTTDQRQAVKFAKTTVRKAISNGLIPKEQKTGFVSSFIFSPKKQLSIYRFNDADRDWLHCVVAHRRENDFKDIVRQWTEYDLICGKIANDNTNLVITAYMDGLYGELMSDGADMIAIGFLEPENLKDQFCFRTEKAIQSLELADIEEVLL